MKMTLRTWLCRCLRPLFPTSPLPSNPKTILVLKPCCLGDVVLATPTIAALKQRYPQAMIDVVVGSWSRPVLENHPAIRHLIDSQGVGQGPYRLSAIRSLLHELQPHDYDLAVTLDRSPVVGLLPWLAGIKHRLGLDSMGRGFAHTVRVPVTAQPRHEALIYLDTVAATGLPIAQAGQSLFWPQFYPTSIDIVTLPSIEKEPFVILHPSGGVNPGLTMLSKRWPLDRWAKLAGHLAATGYHLVLTGTTADIPLCEELSTKINQVHLQIVSGQLSLSQFGALCQKAALFIGGDTGAMHLATAVGCKTIAILGPSDPKRYGAFAPPNQAITLWRDVPLPPGGVGQGRVQFSWAQGVDVDEVWAACEKLL